MFTRGCVLAPCPLPVGHYRIILASLQVFALAKPRALRLDPPAGTARSNHTGNNQQNSHNDHNPALPSYDMH
jgi:hypothetical protein